LKDSSPDESEKKSKKKGAEKAAPKDEDFKFIVRMVNTDIDGEKSLLVGLASIKGIGLRIAQAICQLIDLDPKMKMGTIDDESIDKLEDIVTNLSDHLPPWMVNR